MEATVSEKELKRRHPLTEGRVADLIRTDSDPLITARPDDSKTTIIERMKVRGVSQMPVVDQGGRYLGMVTEVDLLQHLLLPDHQKGESIADIVSEDEAVPVASDAALETLPEILNGGKVVIVLEGDRPIQIVTKIDLIDYLAGRIEHGRPLPTTVETNHRETRSFDTPVTSRKRVSS